MNQIGNIPSLELTASIVEHLPYGIISVDLHGVVTLCNQKAIKHLALEGMPAEMIGRPIAKLLSALPKFADKIERRITKDCKPFDFIGKPAKKRFLTMKGRPIPNGMLITIDDVTASKSLERSSINAMLEGQESERRRLAKEIHDGVGPIMSTIKLNLGAVRNELQDVPEKTLKKINAMGELIEQVADDIRSISHALMPSALVDLGLVLALENLCQKANESEKVTVTFYQVGMEQRLELKVALSLYRITQELLNNAFKYAQAEIINVQLIKYPNSVMLMVEDDGVGFDPAAISELIESGIGLRNIETRTRLLNGVFNIETQPGNGVLAIVEVPLN
ncbi:MAG: PAS domain-containing sensor histidine kinase [Saprospiraceae bacterium]